MTTTTKELIELRKLAEAVINFNAPGESEEFASLHKAFTDVAIPDQVIALLNHIEALSADVQKYKDTLQDVRGHFERACKERDQLSAQLEARGEAVAWLVELNLVPGHPEWFTGGPTNSAEFSSDPNKALRFARRNDAQAMLDWLRSNNKLFCVPSNTENFHSVTEHMWVGPQVAAAHTFTDTQVDRALVAAHLRVTNESRKDMLRALESVIHHDATHPAPAAPVAELEIEAALTELVDKICPGLDTGDLLVDAKTASKELSQKQVDWIPVVDRLPEWAARDDTPCVVNGKQIEATLTSTKVLVTIAPHSAVRIDNLVAIEGGLPWWDTYGDRVIAWSPLPAAALHPTQPKGEKA